MFLPYATRLLFLELLCKNVKLKLTLRGIIKLLAQNILI